MKTSEFKPVKLAKNIVKDKLKWYNKMMDTKENAKTPDSTTESVDELADKYCDDVWSDLVSDYTGSMRRRANSSRGAFIAGFNAAKKQFGIL